MEMDGNFLKQLGQLCFAKLPKMYVLSIALMFIPLSLNTYARHFSLNFLSVQFHS